MLRRLASVCVVAGAVLIAAARPGAQPAVSWPTPGARVHLHAHNCYPDRGAWADRLDRALAAGAPHLAVEQDLVWVPASGSIPGRSVVTHEAPATGHEPTLEQHFFDRVRPLMDQALREDRRERWPVLVLHLDFKTNEPEHHRYVWELLGRHAAWLTTARRTASGTPPSPLQPGPLLVLTEQGEGQEWTFHLTHPLGTHLRLFGTVPSETLASATSYRRWINFSWAAVEPGGPPKAGAWLANEHQRLRALTSAAHEAGLWIRFYGLNGHDGPGQGWSAGYNFGSREAVQARWRAAIEASVDFIATDQYEGLAEELRRYRRD
jgi:hypothetical protein